MSTPSEWQYFTVEELSCRGSDCCGGKSLMKAEFMEKIVILRRELGFPFIISSAYRCPIHNNRVSSTGENGPHVSGMALDIAVHHNQAIVLLKAAFATEIFTGIGINQKGPVNKRFVHLDDIPGPDRLWTY